MWNLSFYVWLGAFIRSQMFAVNDGNEDWADLVNPEKYGLTHTQNIYITKDSLDGLEGVLDEGDKIGAWWIRALPKDGDKMAEKPSDKYTRVLHEMPVLGTDDTVFILLHGNAKNRGASHRIAAYQLFQKQGYHTLTVDYRGWGDSTMSGEGGGFERINEKSLIDDAVLAARFVRKEVGDQAKLVLYGHSMGTGIASRTAAECLRANIRVDGVILDSPFHSLKDMFEGNQGFMSKVLSVALDADKLIKHMKVEFNSPKWLSNLKIPVTVFVAESDPVTPPHLSDKLVADVRKSGKKNIELIKWTEPDLGHIGISKTKGFPINIREFVKSLHAKDKDTKSKL